MSSNMTFFKPSTFFAIQGIVFCHHELVKKEESLIRPARAPLEIWIFSKNLDRIGCFTEKARLSSLGL
jgi:hypothetical protein